MSHNNGFKRRNARSKTAERTRELSRQAVARKLGSTDVEPHMGVGVQDKSVVLTFPQAVTVAKFSPAQARALAAALVQQADIVNPPAVEQGGDLHPANYEDTPPGSIRLAF